MSDPQLKKEKEDYSKIEQHSRSFLLHSAAQSISDSGSETFLFSFSFCFVSHFLALSLGLSKSKRQDVNDRPKRRMDS